MGRGIQEAPGTTTGLAEAALHVGCAHEAALFERVIERIYRTFHALIRDGAEAEECAHRTLLALETSLRDGKYDPSRSFNSWMWLKAHSVFVDWCRERGRRLEPLEAETECSARASSTQASVEERLDVETVLREIERRLGTEVYECFVLRYGGGLTLAEVAEAVGRDRKTVSDRLARAHALADRLLGKESSE